MQGYATFLSSSVIKNNFSHGLFRRIHCCLRRIHQPAQLAVPVCEKPYTHRGAYAK